MQEASPEAAATTKKEAVAGSAMEESSSTETTEEGEGVDDGDEARSEAVITFKVVRNAKVVLWMFTECNITQLRGVCVEIEKDK